ncbi:MAG: ABC transporter permease [Phycisphaerae bacterium]|nr:ABC transporter permease [Phycisphaerae bacterium]
MKPTTALIWKEWREQRWFLLAGLGFFLALPLTQIFGWNMDDATLIYVRVTGDMVLCLGGLMAVLVGVGTATRDSKPSLETFWRSQPVSPLIAFLVKYAAGLVTTLLACCLPVLVTLTIRYVCCPYVGDFRPAHPLPYGVLGMHTFCWALIFSIAFLLGSLVRRASHAAVLSVGAALLVYFLPIVLPPLRWFSVLNLMELADTYGDFSYVFRVYSRLFVGGMLTAIAVSLALAWWAVRRDWRLRLDLRLMCWTLGATLLLLFGAGAFQLRANLECERKVVLPPPAPRVTRWVRDVVPSAQGGLVLLQDTPWGSNARTADCLLCRWDQSSPGAVTAPRFVFRGLTPDGYGLAPGELLGSPERSDHVYFMRRGDPTGYVLCTIALGAGGDASVLNELELEPNLPRQGDRPSLTACLHEQTIYVYRVYCEEKTLLSISLDDPNAPRIARRYDLSMPWYRLEASSDHERPVLSVDMVPCQELSPAERLDVTVRLRGHHSTRSNMLAVEGDLLVVCGHYAPSVYRLTGIRGDRAEYVQIGRREPLPIERVVHTAGQIRQIAVRDGFVYVLGRGADLTVYDIRQPEHPRRAYHYVAGDHLGPMAILPDGRALVGCLDMSWDRSELHILAVPESK